MFKNKNRNKNKRYISFDVNKSSHKIFFDEINDRDFFFHSNPSQNSRLSIPSFAICVYKTVEIYRFAFVLHDFSINL